MTGTKRPKTGTRGHYRVLVADDDERSLDSLVALLSRDGFAIEPFLGGLDALARLGLGGDLGRSRDMPQDSMGTPEIDFLVLDYNMPDVTGIEVLRRIRIGFGNPLPAILVSGESSCELERLWLDEGGFALLPKPVIPDDFRHEVGRLVSRFFGGRSKT